MTLNWIRIVALILILAGSSAAGAMTMLCLGDSLTEGFGVTKAQAWPALLETSLASRAGKWQMTVVNAGVSGSTTASGFGRLQWHLKSKRNFDWIFIELGANDGLRGQDVEMMKKNLVKTIALAKEAKIKGIFLADMRVPMNYGSTYAKNFQAAFAQVAKDQKIQLVPFMLEGVAGKPELNLPDGIHPNVEGHKIVAKNLETFFVKELSKLK